MTRSIWNRMLRGLGVCAAALVVAACGGSGNTNEDVPPPPPAAVGSATIGAEGGTVHGPDGVSLTIPPGALESPVTFRIARNSAGAPALPAGVPADTVVYEITPHEQVFLKPVTVNYEGAESAGEGNGERVVMAASAGGEWATQTTSRQSRSMQAKRLSLSYYVFPLLPWRGPGIGCSAPPPGVSDPYWCTQAHIDESTVTATPASALPPLTRRWYARLTEPATLHFDVQVIAPGDCTGHSMKLARWSLANPFLPERVRSEPVTVSPSPISTLYAVGRYRTSEVVGPADNGNFGYRFEFSCTRSGSGGRKLAVGLFILQADLATTPATPTITQQPASLTLTDGQGAGFSVRGTALDRLSIEWERSVDNGLSWTSVGSGTTVAGGSDLALGAVRLADNGARFRALVCNVRATRNCVLSDEALLTVVAATVAPSFSVGPSDLSIIAGQTASFTVVATGVPLPEIRWEVAVPSSATFTDVTGEPACVPTPAPASGGDVRSVCTIAATTVSISGSRYRAVARNSAAPAGVVSPVATLTVNPGASPPAFVQQPQSVITTVGGSARFTYAASGTAPISAEWRLNGTRLPAALVGGACTGTAAFATNALTLSGLSAGCDGAQITVSLSNGVGSGVTSLPALLTVNPPTVNPARIELDYSTGVGLLKAALTPSGGVAVVVNGTLRLLGLTDLRGGAVTSVVAVVDATPVIVGSSNVSTRAVLYKSDSTGGSCIGGNQLRAVYIHEGPEGGTWISPPALLHTSRTGTCLFGFAGAMSERGFEFAVTGSDGSLTVGTTSITIDRTRNSWGQPSLTKGTLSLPAECAQPDLRAGGMAAHWDVLAEIVVPGSSANAVMVFTGGSGPQRATCATKQSAFGTWSAAVPVWLNGLDASGIPALSEPVVAMDRLGNALLAGSRRVGSGFEVATAFLPATDSVWQIESSQPAFRMLGPALAFDYDGNATLLYRTEPTASDTFASVFAARRAFGGGWEPRVRLTAGTGNSSFPRLSVARNGDVLALFSYAEAPAPFQVYVSRQSGGAWSTPLALQAPGSPEGRFAEVAPYWTNALAGNGGLFGLSVYWRETNPVDPTRVRIMSSALN